MSTGNRTKKNKKKNIQKTINTQTEVYSVDEVLSMMDETSQLLAQENYSRLASMGPSAGESGALVNSVEFWDWMNRNYAKSGHFASSDAMQAYMSGTAGQQNWAKKVVQGKGYEWDWMSAQRRSFKNLFKTFDAGDVANRPGSDITAHDILSGTDTEYQLKAYTSKNTPHLKNTPKDMAVVTNAEKVEQVSKLGYDEVISFGNNDSIQAARDSRLEKMTSGEASPNYTVKNVGITVAKSGILGFVVNAGVETIVSYRKFKEGKISGQQYLKEIMKSGGNSGINAVFSSGIMIPVSAAITKAGISSLVTFPVSFVVTAAVDKIVAPAFARGDYLKILHEATYYRDLTEFCGSLAHKMDVATDQYSLFIKGFIAQQQEINELAKGVITEQALKDFEYYASLPMDEADSVLAGMVELMKDTDSKFSILQSQNWFQRMIKTVTGINKATKEDLKRNHEKLGVYVSKAVGILYERHCVSEKIVLMYGEEILALNKGYISLSARFDTLESRVDAITNALIYRTPSSPQTISVKQIIDEESQQTYAEAERLFVKGKLIDAFPLFKKAADNNCARAYYYLGEYYAEGYGHIVNNRTEALENWRKGMSLGDVLSTYQYGLLKYDGNDTLYNKWMKEHIHSVLQLVKENDSAALVVFGWHILLKNPNDIDTLVDSLGYFKKAADKGYWPGAKMFYQFTEDLRRTGTNLHDYTMLIKDVECYETHNLIGLAELLYTNDYIDSVRHFQKSLWLRDDVVEAAGYLAFILNTGLVPDSLADGISKDSIPMYFNAGLKSDNAFMHYQFGALYYNGIGEKSYGKDLRKAYKCFERSYAILPQGFVAGQLGYMLLTGEGVEENEKKAIKYLIEGDRLGDLNATMILSQCYENGYGVEKNIQKSILLSEKGKQLSAPDASSILKSYIDHGITKHREMGS
ncbi:Sel1 repeat-containing protein [Ruminococcus sp. YE71]|uniref:tetratricopeptide repeat protein n=1 Tax=unclassified Ruminococcus TaxID=2608920 RepID=UPI0008858AD3|nr:MULTISPECIES: tetratricopeptide repeat protein [unclassified Ruminococcus]SDA24896.1 Sel1 repeat-containing protein [Ruminococcus sp. YE78]SFW43296.1 Sel1 repeat-containing protein [Ruminococcus sp. YE71]